MKKISFLLLIISVFFVMCKPKSLTREQRVKEIVETEKTILNNDQTFLFENAQKLMDMYTAYVQDFPQDTAVPEFLIRCAVVATGAHQETYALTLYERVLTEYPQSPLCSEALFREAYTCDNHIGDKDNAKSLYERFILLYPNDPLAEDAKFLLENVYKTDEELFELIQERAQEETE